jgi:hypothetical protein
MTNFDPTQPLRNARHEEHRVTNRSCRPIHHLRGAHRPRPLGGANGQYEATPHGVRRWGAGVLHSLVQEQAYQLNEKPSPRSQTRVAH